jgi:hypothetical protein
MMAEITGKYEIEESTENAMEMLGDGSASPLRKRIWAKSGGLCWYCGSLAHQVDHIDPVVLHGSNSISNKVPVCRWCNKSKRGQPLEIWRAKMALKMGLAFTEAQRRYWGNQLPRDKQYVFWFEREGLKA